MSDGASPTRNWRSYGWVALIVLLVVALSSWKSGRLTLQLVSQGGAAAFDAPIQLTDASQVVRVTWSGSTPGALVRLRLHVRGRFALVKPIPGGPHATPLAAAGKCTADAGGTERCTILLPVPSEGALAVLATVRGNAAELLAIEGDVMRAPYQIAWREQGVRIAIIALVLLLLVVPFIHRWRRISEWVIVGGATLSLAAVSPLACALLWIETVVVWWYLSAGRGDVVRSHGRRQRVLLSLVAGAASILVSFKLIQQHGAGFPLGPLGLPLGLSFFSIRLIDTLLTWRGRPDTQATFGEFVCYLLFPATLVAGPVDTLANFRASRLSSITASEYGRGAQRALFGIAKKVVLADYLIAPLVFGENRLLAQVLVDPAQVSWLVITKCLFTALLFAYLDFSAYADIAVGTGRMLGRRVPENFNRPFLATSPRDYWRRWHISLSQWAFRNLFFPFAVVTKSRSLPMYGVMLSIGLWHAFTLSWMAWALHHATGLVVESRVAGARRPGSAATALLTRPAKVLGTLTFVAAGLAFVIIADFSTAVAVYVRFLTLGVVSW